MSLSRLSLSPPPLSGYVESTFLLWGLGFMVQDLVFRTEGSNFRAWGLGFKISGLIFVRWSLGVGFGV